MAAKTRRLTDEDDAATNALLAGLAATAVPATVQSLYHQSKDAEDFERVKRSMSRDAFLSKLQPGDVLFHRHSYKDSPQASYGRAKIPLTESEIMTLFKGDPNYHGSVYTGRGLINEAADFEKGVKRTNLKHSLGETPSDVFAYRPKDPSAAKRAVDFAEKAIGWNYPTADELIKHGVSHIAGISGGTPRGRLGCDGITCTELTSEALPGIVKDRYASPLEIRHNPAMELVARYERAPPMSSLEKFLAKVGYPLLKNAKWALPAAGIAYALSGDDDESLS